MATPSLRKCITFSGVQEMSVESTSTSLARPPSSQAAAVSRPALPEAHIAETFIAGPWKPNSCMSVDIGVDGISDR